MVAEGPAHWSQGMPAGPGAMIGLPAAPAARASRIDGMSRLWLLPLAVGGAGGGLLVVANRRLVRELRGTASGHPAPPRPHRIAGWAREPARPARRLSGRAAAHMGRVPLHSP